MVGAQDSNSVFDVPGVNWVSTLQQIVEFTEQFTRERLFGMVTGNFEAAAIHSDTDTESLLDGSKMAIVLPEQFREETVVVEMNFERILVG